MFTVGSGLLDRSLARFNRNKQKKIQLVIISCSRISIQSLDSNFQICDYTWFPHELAITHFHGETSKNSHDLVNHHIPFLVIAVRVNTKIG